VQYCRWFRDFLAANGEDILDVTIFDDEAWFRLSGYVNSKNNSEWLTFNPQNVMKTRLHDQKAGVRCATSRSPIFFEQTVNCERHCQLILYPFIGHLNEGDIAHGYIQQGGATAHMAHVTMALLRGVFDGPLISRGIGLRGRPILLPLICICQKQ
jgi:hypothetical protein